MSSDLVKRVLGIAVAVQQIPAPTFSEQRRAEFLYEQFLAEGLCDVMRDDLGNVYGRLPGEGQRRPLIVSAHSDTVFPPGTELTLRRTPGKIYGPGIGDNSLGVAGLFGLLWLLRQGEIRLPGDLWLVANVGEEGLGDLRGMRAVVERFSDQPLAYLILEGMALGQVYHRALGVQRYRITVKTQGGHSWVDFGRPSAIHELAALINRITALPLPARPRSTFNVGVISGGTSVNTIAPECSCDLDLRSEGVRQLAELSAQVMELVKAANRADVQVDALVIGRRPAGKLSAEHPLVVLGKRCLEALGLQPSLGIGSTDANIPLSRGLPAICVGLSTGGGAHTTAEFIDTPPLENGLAQLQALVPGVFLELT